MPKRLFYLDSCIWLNLFKKEGDPTKGIPYWKIAEDFIEKLILSEDKEIIYSGFILKEMKFKLDKETFQNKCKILKKDRRIKFIKAIEEDRYFARKLESYFKYKISFFDCLHSAICKRLNSTLVTRDNDLLKFAKEIITADKPEDLLS